MKPAVLRPRLRQDRREQVRYYRDEAGPAVVSRLVLAIRNALRQCELNPGIGSPTLGKTLRIERLRTWRVRGFPLVLLYIERADHLDFVRLLGERQDILDIIAHER